MKVGLLPVKDRFFRQFWAIFYWLLADERFLFCYSDFYIPNSIDHILIAENVNVLL
jgi:hypothetical protein